MVKGLPLISMSLSRTCSLCWPRLMAVYDVHLISYIVSSDHKLQKFTSNSELVVFQSESHVYID